MIKKEQAVGPDVAALVAEEVRKQLPYVSTGVSVAIPNTTELKMQSILHLSAAVEKLAIALASTNVSVKISDVNISNVGCGIRIGEQEKVDKPFSLTAGWNENAKPRCS